MCNIRDAYMGTAIPRMTTAVPFGTFGFGFPCLLLHHVGVPTNILDGALASGVGPLIQLQAVHAKAKAV